jgi:hypothetical protein
VRTDMVPEQFGQCLLVWAQETHEQWLPVCKHIVL